MRFLIWLKTFEWFSYGRKFSYIYHKNISDFVPLAKSEIFTTMTMKNAVFWELTPCDSCKNRRFGGTHLHYQVGKNLQVKNKITNNVVFLRSVLRLLVTVNVFPSLLILLSLMMEEIYSPETSVLTRATRLNIPEYGILYATRVCIFYISLIS
jgi:hypothetical protein